MMCRICGGRYENGELEKLSDSYPLGDGAVEQTTNLICPDCGSPVLYEECGCAECGEELPSAELDEGLCRFCVAEVTQTLDWMWGMLTPAQKRWATEHTEWME